ncbi:unnamed protein product, partial [Hymenolepis diminuta]
HPFIYVLVFIQQAIFSILFSFQICLKLKNKSNKPHYLKRGHVFDAYILFLPSEDLQTLNCSGTCRFFGILRRWVINCLGAKMVNSHYRSMWHMHRLILSTHSKNRTMTRAG